MDMVVMLPLTHCACGIIAKENRTERYMELADMNGSDRTYIFPFTVGGNSFSSWSLSKAAGKMSDVRITA